MAISISLNQTIKLTDRGTAQVTFKAEGSEITSKIFAIEVLPGSADKLSPHYRFSHVCHPSELLEMPESEMDEYSYFRTDEVEFIFDSPTPVDRVACSIRGDIAHLVNELNALVTLDGFQSTVVIQ